MGLQDRSLSAGWGAPLRQAGRAWPSVLPQGEKQLETSGGRNPGLNASTFHCSTAGRAIREESSSSFRCTEWRPLGCSGLGHSWEGSHEPQGAGHVLYSGLSAEAAPRFLLGGARLLSGGSHLIVSRTPTGIGQNVPYFYYCSITQNVCECLPLPRTLQERRWAVEVSVGLPRAVAADVRVGTRRAGPGPGAGGGREAC